MTDFLRICSSRYLVSLLFMGITLALCQDSSESERGPENVKNGHDEGGAMEGRAETPSINPLQQWLSGGSGTMILGTYQALLVPMPQGQDMANGINNVVQGVQGLIQG